MKITADTVIDDLGGTGALARALGLSDPTISCWRRNGIPAERWPEIVRLARAARLSRITYDALAAARQDSMR
jgi:DNA-binding transcriptional regulator YdaS (Cro superfamily)